MGIEEVFAVLNIQVTKDENSIKQAYRNKLTTTNPEDNPEGFKRLREAYDTACAYARSGEMTDDEEADDTPGGRWLQKAKDLYGRLDGRMDTAAWEALFDDDIYKSIEGEEECRIKLLTYMMGHYCYPTAVWEILDRNLKIVHDSGRLKELFPVDFIDYIVHKCINGENLDFSLFEGPQNADYDLYIQYYGKSFAAINDGDTALARQLVGECEQLGIFHPVIEIVRANIYMAENDTDKAIECCENIYNRYPSELTVAYNYADICWKLNLRDRAAAVLQRIKEDNDEHYMSNVYLTEWYYDRKEYEKAKKCAEIVMAIGAGTEFYGLLGRINTELEKQYECRYAEEGDIQAATELCWCYLQDGKFFKGMRLAESLRESIASEDITSYTGLLTKLYYEEAEYEKAIETALVWRDYLNSRIKDETGRELEDDYNRICQTYIIRAGAYHMMGYADKKYYDHALNEIDELYELPDEFRGRRFRHIDIQDEKAKIYFECEEYNKCIETAEKLINEHQAYGEHIILLDAYSKLWDAGNVIEHSRQCISYFPYYAHAYEEAARVYSDLRKPDQLTQVLVQAEENGVKSVLLDAYTYRIDHDVYGTLQLKMDDFDRIYKNVVMSQYRNDDYEKAYKRLTQIIYEYPCIYTLIERGLLAMNFKHYDEAKNDFLKVLVSEPYNQFALNNLGCVYKYTGDYEKAIVCFKKAIRYMDKEPNKYPYGNLAHTYKRMGEYGLAVQVYEALNIRFEKDTDKDRPDYLIALARAGEETKALELLEKTENRKAYYHKAQVKLYINSNNMDGLKKALTDFNKSLKTVYDKRLHAKLTNRYIIYMAYYKLLTGRYTDAVTNIKQTLGSNNADGYEGKVLGEYLFMLMMDEQGKRYEKTHNTTESSQDDYVRHIKDIIGRKQNADDDQCRETDRIVEKLRYVTDFRIDKYRIEYFNKERMHKWLQFLIAYASDDMDEINAAYEELCQSVMCRLCDRPSCSAIALAKGMMLEKQGKENEAREIYAGLNREQPYNILAKAKLLYM